MQKQKTVLKISTTSKLDGIRSWSLPAVDTCPGAKQNGVFVPACAGCYATTGFYRMGPAIAVRENNKIDWTRKNWVDRMVLALENDRYFRWFDSGDVYTAKLAEKIYHVMLNTPWVKHWIPTRSHTSHAIRYWLKKMNALPNVAVRPSSDSIDGTFKAGLHGSTIVPTSGHRDGVKICMAYENNGKCSGCRACWDKTVPVIGYVAHGHKMAKVIKIHAA